MDDFAEAAGSWSDWLQDVSKQVITTKTQSDYNPQLQLAKMQMQAFGPYGQPYTEGKANAQPLSLAGIPSWMLLAAGAIVLVVVLKD